MIEEQREQHHSSDDEETGDGEFAEAVEYGSRHHPVVLRLILFDRLVALLFLVDSTTRLSAARSSLENVPHFLQLFLHRLQLRCFRGRRHDVVVAVAVDAPDVPVHDESGFRRRSRRPLYTQTCC